MTEHDGVWGAGPSARYEEIASRFRPLFERIRAGAAARERDRRLPHEEIGWLKAAGFTALRVPESHGGPGLSLPEFFALLTELAAADSNLAQILRVHVHVVEDLAGSTGNPRRDAWLDRILHGDIFGGAWTEGANSIVGTFTTRLAAKDGRLTLSGTKYYSTGAIFADWIDIGAVDEAGEKISVIVPARAPGIDLVDDWDGFGQTLTGSGTSRFTDVPVEPENVLRGGQRIAYSPAFLQVVHLATLAGLARGAARDVATAVHERRRNYTHAAAAHSREDPQVLQVVGRVHARAYAAGTLVQGAAAAVQRAHDAGRSGDAAALERANVAAEIEVAQAQAIVLPLVLEATTILFDALGASAVSRTVGLDRYWRNARTIASHNPVIYKERIVGAYAVNRTPPPFQWYIGNVPAVG